MVSGVITRFAFVLVLGLGLVLAGCGDRGDGDGGDTDAGGGGDDAGMPDAGSMRMEICSMPTAVPCTDQSILDLALYTDPNPAMIENTAEGTGFATHVDATGGGFMPTLSYVYARFTDTGLERVDVGDEAAFESMDWDIAFRRFVIRLNSGVSGPSCVGAARTGPATDYETLATADPSLEYRNEQYYTDTCDYIPDGSGLNSPGTALQSFWEYPGCVKMTGNVYVLRLASGRRLKLTVTSYYNPDIQMMCDSAGTIPMGTPNGSGNIRLRWAFLEP